jgi:hypothetical protein
MEHDLFGKPVSTFPDHALEREESGHARGHAFTHYGLFLFVQKRVLRSPLLTCSRWRESVRIFIAIAAAWLAASFAARAEVTYTITSYPAGLADLPCDAFKKNPDGSWTQVAILVAGGALIVSLHFKNTNETRIIESKCDRK